MLGWCRGVDAFSDHRRPDSRTIPGNSLDFLRPRRRLPPSRLCRWKKKLLAGQKKEKRPKPLMLLTLKSKRCQQKRKKPPILKKLLTLRNRAVGGKYCKSVWALVGCPNE